MKTNFKTLIACLIFIIISSIISAIAIILRFENTFTSKLVLLFVIFIILIMLITIIYSIRFISKKQRVEIKKSFEQYIEELLSNIGVGAIMFNNEGIIIWTSKFINDRFKNTLMGKNIIDISKLSTEEINSNKNEFIFELEKMIYEAKIVRNSNSIIIKDVSDRERIQKKYINERTVIGEIDIDNFQEYLSTLPEEIVFSIQSSIIKVLDKLVEKYKIIYRQYINSKFLIITDNETLEILQKQDFKELIDLETKLKVDNIKTTISVGFGTGSTIPSELIQLAKDALSQSQSRGGNQITIASLQSGYKYYGANTEAFSTSSRVSIIKLSELFFSTLKSEDIKTVLVYGHKMADLDSIGSAYAIYEQAKKMGKEAFIVGSIFDNSSKKAIKNFIPDSKNVFLKPHLSNSYMKKSTMVVICDVADPERTENPYALVNIPRKNIFIFDHHRVSELPKGVLKTNTYIDASVSSASEIITELIQYAKINLKPSLTAAQLLLSGIYLDTKIFQKKVSSRTFAAASWLEIFGAKAEDAVDLLKFSEENSNLIRKILSNLEEVKPGYYIASYPYEADSDVVASAADEILRTQGRLAAFVIAKVPGKKLFKMSSRSVGVNVQIIAEEVGGGGHFSAAAATSEEPLLIFKDNITQAIISRGKDAKLK
ncbi:MAG: hypothetical protein GY679_02900 [Mycoplasma sp.]|nr:hypothetical protein [Mycoplasma sp.]